MGVPLFKLGRQNRQTGYALLSTFVVSSRDGWLLVFSSRESSMQNNARVR